MTTAEAPRRKPQQLILSLLGNVEHLDDLAMPVPAATFITVLEEFSIAQPAIRATLQRMVERGLLTAVRSGRTVSYLATDRMRAVLAEGSDRVHAPAPFAPAGPGWTLVTFSIAEHRRELRHRLRGALSWAGFGPLRNGLWIAPGDIDTAELLAGVAMPQEDSVVVFRAALRDPAQGVELAAMAWDLDEVEAAHRAFIGTWEKPDHRHSGLAGLTALASDWLGLLRIDPRLPDDLLLPGWPAARSTEIFHERFAALEHHIGSVR